MKQRTIASKPVRPRFKFFGDIISELKKVVWLTRREAFYLTALVLIVAGVAGLILTALDYGFSQLVNVYMGR